MFAAYDSLVTPQAESVPDTEALKTGGKLFAQSFKSGDLQHSDEDEIPMPNATSKMRVGCRVVASYKRSARIACAEHAMEDMRPFTLSTRKCKHVVDELEPEVYITFISFFKELYRNNFIYVNS